MKNPLLKLTAMLATSALLTSTMFMSCSDDPAPVVLPDEESPVITITSPTVTGYLKGTVTIEASATDNQNLKSLKILIDNVVAKEVEAGDISYAWDSKLAEDGARTITVVATDDSGNESTKSLDVELYNYFFVLHVIDGYISENGSAYAYLSDVQGNVLGDVKELANGGTTKFETPDNFENGDEVVLNFVSDQRDTPSSLRYTNMTITPGLTNGEHYLVPFKPGTLPLAVGNASLTVTDVPDPMNQVMRIAGPHVLATSSTYDGTVTLGAVLSQVPSKAIITIKEDAAVKYKAIDPINDGDNGSISYADLTDMQSVTYTREGAFFNFFSTYAVENDNLFSLWYQGGEPNLTLYYPGSLYAEYVFQTYYASADRSEATLFKASSAPVELPEMNLVINNVAYTDRVLSVSAAGTYDLLTLHSSKTSPTDETHFLNVYCNLSEANEQSIVLPQVPAEIATAYDFPDIGGFAFTRAQANDYAVVEDYEHYLSFLFSAEGHYHSIDQMKGFKQSDIVIPNSGGRMNTRESARKRYDEYAEAFRKHAMLP